VLMAKSDMNRRQARTHSVVWLCFYSAAQWSGSPGVITSGKDHQRPGSDLHRSCANQPRGRSTHCSGRDGGAEIMLDARNTRFSPIPYRAGACFPREKAEDEEVDGAAEDSALWHSGPEAVVASGGIMLTRLALMNRMASAITPPSGSISRPSLRSLARPVRSLGCLARSLGFPARSLGRPSPSTDIPLI
jgi:hypothetical protein